MGSLVAACFSEFENGSTNSTLEERDYILRDPGLWLRVKKIRDPGQLSRGREYSLVSKRNCCIRARSNVTRRLGLVKDIRDMDLSLHHTITFIQLAQLSVFCSLA